VGGPWHRETSLFLAKIVRKYHRAPTLLDPRESLGGRIDLVVVLASGEGRKFVQILGEPWDLPRQRYEAVFNCRGLRMETHHLVAHRGDCLDDGATILDELLNQLCARRLILNQYYRGSMELSLLSDRPFEFRVIQSLAQDMEHSDHSSFDPDSQTHGEVTQFGWLVGRIPTLHNLIKCVGDLACFIAFESVLLDHPSAERGGGLLVLSGKVILPDGLTEASERVL
jgi:hypothetical protein